MARLRNGFPSIATRILLVLLADLRFFSAVSCCFCLAATVDVGGAVERNGLALFAIDAYAPARLSIISPSLSDSELMTEELATLGGDTDAVAAVAS